MDSRTATADDNREMEHINWEHLFDGFGDDQDLKDLCNLSPDSMSLSIEEIEQFLMKDDEGTEGPNQELNLEFLSDIFLDSPVDSTFSGEDIDVTQDEDEDEEERVEVHDAVVTQSQQKDNRMNDVVEDEDPITKKRKRQMRNRDAAVRSRERKKMYVKDLELKSRYYEAECRRLGNLLHCCMAENQALRFSLHNSKAVSASMTKQESAVLLLESLLLGSLLWLLGMTGLLILPRQLRTTQEVELEKLNVKMVENLLLRKSRSKILTQVFPSFVMGKRCKASRPRMKTSAVAVLVMT